METRARLLLLTLVLLGTTGCASMWPWSSRDRVDAVVIAFHSNFCTFARFTHNAFDGDESIINFRHFLFK